MLYKARNEATKFFNDYTSVISEVRNKAKNKTGGKGLKILTPKKLLQRLQIAVAEVKAGNNSKSDKLFIICSNQKKSLRKQTMTINSIQLKKWILYS